MKNNNKPLFIYPDYIVQVLNQLMEDSVKNQNGILCKRTDIGEILYNQFNDFPITEQVYRMMWSWVNKMLDAGHYDWIKQYWNIANQYCTFKLEYSDKAEIPARGKSAGRAFNRIFFCTGFIKNSCAFCHNALRSESIKSDLLRPSERISASLNDSSSLAVLET